MPKTVSERPSCSQTNIFAFPFLMEDCNARLTCSKFYPSQNCPHEKVHLSKSESWGRTEASLQCSWAALCRKTSKWLFSSLWHSNTHTHTRDRKKANFKRLVIRAHFFSLSFNMALYEQVRKMKQRKGWKNHSSGSNGAGPLWVFAHMYLRCFPR